MDLVGLGDKYGCLGRQKSDGIDGGVLDQQISNRKAGVNGKAGYLDWETEGWAINHGIAGQRQVLE